MSKPYDVLIVDEYQAEGGEIKQRFYNVGVAFENKKGGMSIELPPGIAISGRAIILPRKFRDAAADDAAA